MVRGGNFLQSQEKVFGHEWGQLLVPVEQCGYVSSQECGIELEQQQVQRDCGVYVGLGAFLSESVPRLGLALDVAVVFVSGLDMVRELGQVPGKAVELARELQPDLSSSVVGSADEGCIGVDEDEVLVDMLIGIEGEVGDSMMGLLPGRVELEDIGEVEV